MNTTITLSNLFRMRPCLQHYADDLKQFTYFIYRTYVLGIAAINILSIPRTFTLRMGHITQKLECTKLRYR